MGPVENGFVARPWGPEARAELLSMCLLAPLLVSDTRAPVRPAVYSSHASPSRGGVTQTTVCRAEAE
eukprot:3471508-Lingulodinium_polyedra.AAC.1